MRYCPVCQTNYTNETLKFCLQDGTTLVELPAQDLEATQVTPKFPSHPTQVVPLSPPTMSSYSPVPAAPQSSGLGWKITVAVLALALVSVLGFVVIRELTRNNNNNNNNSSAARSVTDNAPTPTPKSAPTRAPAPAVSPIPAAPVTPPVSAETQREAESDIEETLNSWVGALRAHDLDDFLSHYADKLEVYYLHRNWSLAQVREDKAEAFAKYDEMSGEINDLRVKVEPPGTRAVATFTKSYYFKNAEKDFSGRTRSEMIFTKTQDGEWLITGERDLR